MDIFKESPTTDFFLVHNPDIADPVPIEETSRPVNSNDPEEDPSYYFQDAIFLVENTFFKVPRHQFEQSSAFFREMFLVEADKGWTKEKPFILDGLFKRDFVAFLKIICPRNVFQRETLSVDDWVSVLKLSTLWNFEEARQSAINNLPFTDLDHPVTRIELAMTYKVRQWFLPALQKLATHEHRLGTEDAQRLGLEFSLKVAELRGKVQGFERANASPSGGWGSGKTSTPTCVPVTDFIKELFPAAVATGLLDDPRPWDPTSLSFSPVQLGTISENGLVMQPATPDSMPDTKDERLVDFSLNEPDPAFGPGPLVSPPWGYEPTTVSISPNSSLNKHNAKGVGGWKVKKKNVL